MGRIGRLRAVIFLKEAWSASLCAVPSASEGCRSRRRGFPEPGDQADHRRSGRMPQGSLSPQVLRRDQAAGTRYSCDAPQSYSGLLPIARASATLAVVNPGTEARTAGLKWIMGNPFARSNDQTDLQRESSFHSSCDIHDSSYFASSQSVMRDIVSSVMVIHVTLPSVGQGALKM